YRGNGSVEVVPDTAFDIRRDTDRNAILYGHGEMNSASRWVCGAGGVGLSVVRGRLTVGTKEVQGDDLAILVTQPRPASDTALIAVVAGTGLPGMRLTDRLPYFSSGAAYPDWVVLDPKGVR